MELLLIRHGESTWNAEGRIQGWADPPLSERGHTQAQLLAHRLSGDGKIGALHASPSRRAAETAGIIGQEMKLVTRLDERLREGGSGELTGLTVKGVQEQFPEVWQSWREGTLRPVIPGGEDIEALQRRVAEVMGEIVAAHDPDGRVAVVSHGGTFCAYLAHLVGLDIHRTSPFRFDNASLSIVSVRDARPRIVTLNDTCHLHETI